MTLVRSVLQQSTKSQGQDNHKGLALDMPRNNHSPNAADRAPPTSSHVKAQNGEVTFKTKQDRTAKTNLVAACHFSEDMAELHKSGASSSRNFKPGIGNLKAQEHPFGREHGVSLHQLFKSFCNNLFLGQWELARACISELHRQRQLLGHNVHELLLDVAENPYGYSLGSESFATPHHLSWLCLQEYTRLLKEDNTKPIKNQIEPLQKEVELRLLLVETSKYSESTTLTELYLFFKDLHNFQHNADKETNGCEAIPALSEQCQHLLCRTLEADPALGHSLIEQLTVSANPALTGHNQQLHRLHLECLFSTLSNLQKAISEQVVDASGTTELGQLVQRFHDLLALLNPRPCMKDLPLRAFFQELSAFLDSDQDVLPIKRVYSALLGRETPYLLEVFCEVDHQWRMKQRQRCTERLNDCILSDVGHQILSLCEDGNRSQAWKDLFLTSIKHEKHFLDLIMETAMCLVKTQQFARLSEMLAPQELRPLRPLVLLVGWDHCTDAEAAKELLQALADWELNATGATVIEQACQRLSYQVDLVQWCLDKTSSLSQSSSDMPSSQQASLVLHGLETHSVLHMLHRSRQLTRLSHEQIFNILSNRPAMNNSQQPPSLDKPKAVRFALDEEQNLRPNPAMETIKDPINIEKERDLSLYRSYCALRAFMTAMYFCADTINWERYVQARSTLLSVHRRHIRTTLQRRQQANHHVMESGLTRSGSIGTRPVGKTIHRSFSHSSAHSSATVNDSKLGATSAKKEQEEEEKAAKAIEDLADFQEVYQQNVVEHLKQGQKFLSELHPLKLRVETLENIFSLLFLTNENIVEEVTALGQWDSGEEGAVPESRSNSWPNSQMGSRDNLSLFESTLEKSPTPSPGIGSAPSKFNFVVGSSNTPIETEIKMGTDQRTIESSSEVEMKETPVGTFSITKTELKDTSSDIQKKNSGNQSTNSAGSTGSVYKIGFSANPYIVRDMLATIKDCLGHLNTAKFRLTGQQLPDTAKTGEVEQLKAREVSLNKHVLSSIESSSLQQRTSRLSQCVSEANWRFQLVAPSQLPSEYGKIRIDKAISEDESHSEDLEEDTAPTSDEEPSKSKRRRRRKTTLTNRASTEESDCKPTTATTTATDDSFGTSSRANRSFRRRRKRKQFLMLGRGGVMPLMLSDKTTLLNMCLKKAKYSQAQQVVKMFSLERTGNAAEVMFAEHYAMAVKTLQNLSKTHGKYSSQGPRFSRPSLQGAKLSLSAIADVAAAGMVTVSATTTVDQILSLNLLPSFSQELLDMVANSASPLAQHINGDYLQAMIVLDLACVAPRQYESTSNLVQMMSQRYPCRDETTSNASKPTRMKRSMSEEYGSTADSSRKMCGMNGGKDANRKSSTASPVLLTMPGVRGYMEQVRQFINLARKEANTEVADTYLKKSLNEVLLTATQPRDLPMLVAHARMMVELDQALIRVQRALQEAHKQETLSLVQAVRAGHQGDIRPSTPPGGLHEKPVIRQAMKHLILTVAKSVPTEGISNHLHNVKRVDDHQKNEYLHRLYEHVKALSCLVHEAHGDKLLASTIEYFQMLEEGPTQILGKLIFVRRISPKRLEDVATKLHVNMLQIIINNCCPLVSCRPSLPPSIALDEEEQDGKLVLNASDGWTGSVQHPGLVVTEILTKLIGLLKDFADLDSPSRIFSPTLMTSVVQDPRYYQLIAGLAHLKYVDLELLESREDKLCFYGNLINLMTLHVLLHQVQNHVRQQETHSRSRHSSFSAFSRQSSYPGPAGSRSPAPGGAARRMASMAPGPVFPDTLVTGLPDGELEWLLLQTHAAYYVGQLGVVSLFDLKYFILRNGLPAPSSYGGIIKDRCHGFRGKNKPSELDRNDPWRIYGPQPEPRILFVISDGHVSSPPIQVLSREMVLNQLRGAMKEYLQRTITVDLDANTVVLPQLLVWHQSDLATDYGNTGLPCEGLLNLLPTQLDPPLADNLRTLMDRHTVQIHSATPQKGKRDIQVVVKPYNMDHTYTFDFDQFSRLHQSSTSATVPGHRRCTSLPWSPPSGMNAAHTNSSKHEDLFHLTPASISYLRSRSELVATLASLVGLIDRLDLQKHLGGEEDERSLSPTGSLKDGRGRPGKPTDRAQTLHEGTISPSRGTSPDAIIGSGPKVTPLSVPSGNRNASRANSSSPRPKPVGTSSPRSSRSGSPASLRVSSADTDTIAEYRYQQLVQRLPHIWRHILHQVVPLEVSRDPDLLTLDPDELLGTLCHREFSTDSRMAVLISPSDQRMYEAALTLTKILMLQRNWLALVRLLRSLPELLLRTFSQLRNLHDFACCCVAYTCGEALDAIDTDSNDLWRHLLLVMDATTRSRAILSMAQFWPVEVAVELLDACYHGDRPNDDTLYLTLEKRLEETRIYQRVTESAKSLLRQKLSQNVPMLEGLTSVSDDEQETEEDGPLTVSIDELTSATLEPLCTWQNVVSASVSSPERVLRILLESHEFEVARKWGAIHGIDRGLQQRIEERFIGFLLEFDNPNQAEAFQVLEGVLSENPENCLGLCDDLLTSLRHRTNTCFIATFMLRHLEEQMNKYRQEELRLLVTGCKALLCLPESARGPYDHLVSAPALLFEQLLMNSKIEWVSKILVMLHSTLPCKTGSAASPSRNTISNSFNVTTCDALLVKYAARALEFPIPQIGCQESTGMVRAESQASITSQVSTVSHSSLMSPMGGGPMGVAVMTSPSPRPVQTSHSSSTLSSLRTGAATLTPTGQPISSSVPRSISGRSSVSRRLSSTPMAHTPSRTPTTNQGWLSAQLTSPPGAFVMPAEPPPKEKWVPDSSAKVCMVCEVEHFSMFVRRHHCRRCGRVVCAGCSSRTMTIKGASARSCDQCYDQSYRTKDVDDLGRLQRLKDRLSGVSSGSGSVSGAQGVTDWSPGGANPTPAISLLTDYTYILSIDDDQNDLHREEFYYDQAPSTSLCLSILELLSSPKECGDTILRLCDDVSKHLQPLAPGVRNQEVDYGLVISMLKYLLFNAKVKLLKAGDNAGVARCDVYLGRLVLLRQLVAANCSYIPSMQQLNKMDSLRRLRDRLIQEERLPLAMDVSTKCGIDPVGVWVAWGMAALRAGDYTTARDKFSHCLKPPVDKNSVHQSGKLLTDIMEQLESGPAPSTSQAEGLLAPLASMKDLLAEPHATCATEVGAKDEAVSRECLFYLNTYAAHIHLVAFYLRHGNMNKAVHYILDRRCSKDVFVEGLVVPCLSSGKLNRLQDCMQIVDPTLEKWVQYITAMCRYMDKHKLIHTLYQTQIFLKDFIRAAMTCITYFYQRDATSYSTLSERVNHLLNAKHHLECYLSDRQWGTTHARPGAARGGGPSFGNSNSQPEASTLRLIMTPGEVNKYINTISLQIDVSKFLQRYNENLDTVTNNLQSIALSASGSALTGPQSPPGASPSGKLFSRSSSVSPDTPATLFGSTRMKADAANLVLLAGNNVNDGFGLAFRIIQDFKLDATFIYVQASRYFARLHKYSSVRQLLSCIKDSGLCTDQSFDDVVSACVRVISGDPAQSKEAEALIKMIRSDASKINAYILCGKLKSAYLIAVKGERVEDIKRIALTAERSGQTAVKKICDKWLAGRIQDRK